MALKIERILEGYQVADAPHWDSENQVLYFVDPYEQTIMRYCPNTKKVYTASLAPKTPTFIIPIAGKKNHFLVSFKFELAMVVWDGESEKVSKVETWCFIKTNWFNDGKCDSSGRLWTGTHTMLMDQLLSEPVGILYSFDSSRQLKAHVDGIRIANGLAFDNKAKKMYSVDAAESTISQFDFDVATGTLSNRKVHFTVSKILNIQDNCLPDGLTVDTDGNLWLAIFGTSKVLKIDGKKPETVLQTIKIPAEQVTSVTFGGKNLDELYVTSACLEIKGRFPPDHGAVYKITNTGSKGAPCCNFRLTEMALKMERVTEGCVFGEAPHYDSENKVLYYVDLIAKDILSYSLITKKVYKASVAPQTPTLIIPIEGNKNHFLVALDDLLADIEWDGQSKSVSKIVPLCTTTANNNKFNDGKCDSSGRLWIGTHTLSKDVLSTGPLGGLYSLDSKRQLKCHIDQIRVANGIAINEHTKEMFFVDSLEATVTRCDFDIISGTISNKQIWFTFSKFNITGIPDGMTVDTDGNLWIANFVGGKVLKVDSKRPETLLQTIDMPCPQVTSLIFGGNNLDELYVTTGSHVCLNFTDLSPPVHGATYKITNTGSKGFPNYNFKLD